MANIKVGDVVKLKSSSTGPYMTVSRQLEANDFVCMWFNEKKVERDTFPAETLEKSNG